MASYYYLMSSLPMLNAEGEMPFSYETFLGMCTSSVSASAWRVLQGLTPDSSEGPFLSKWSAFYAALKNELTYQRNLRLGRPCDPPAERDSDVVRTVTSVMNEANPLKAEEMLLAMEFERVDELTNQHYFDEYSLIGYALKLKLLERKTTLEHDKGRTEFQRILGHLQQQILRI